MISLRDPEIKVPCSVRRRSLMALLARGLPSDVNESTCLLLAEALHHLRGSHDCGLTGAGAVLLVVRLRFAVRSVRISR